MKDSVARPDRVPGPRRTRVAVLASGSGTNFQALADAAAAGRLEGATVDLLVCDRPTAPVIGRAERAGIPVRLVDPTAFPDRFALDAELVRILDAASVDLVVLAGWMRILGPDAVGAYRDRMVNVHPSLLPSFRGMYAIRQALDAGVRVTGATVHMVDDGVDTGRILAQEAVDVLPDDSEASLAARIHPVEHRILCRTVAELASGRLP